MVTIQFFKRPLASHWRLPNGGTVQKSHVCTYLWYLCFSIFHLSDVPPTKLCPNVNVAVDVPDFEAGQPHLALHGSIEGDMTHQFSHTHALYRNDNVKLFNLLEDATRGMKWANTIKAFARQQDGVGAWRALLSNHAGSDK